MTVNDLASQIVRLSSSSSQIVHLPERSGDVKHSRASIGTMVANDCHYVSSLEQGLNKTLGFFRPR